MLVSYFFPTTGFKANSTKQKPLFAKSTVFSSFIYSSLMTILVSTLPNLAHAHSSASISTDISKVQPAPTEQCDAIKPTHVSATYIVTNNAGQQKTITLLRNNDQVIYQRSPVSFELWDANGEYVRYFPAQQRSISYRKGDLLSLNMHFDYEQLSHLIPPSALQSLTQVKPTANNVINDVCPASEYYQGQLGHSQFEIDWVGHLALPANMHIHQDGMQQQYQLVAIKTLSDKAFSALTANYRDLDFADVGDNESDPFIAEMIHQGFIQHGNSGFYDSQGNQLSSNSHQH
ncbi:hypothetical protein TUM4438_28970 [Shewanella sairae]|uniref:Uncharacterized protein n=1 Tax=Shewanella sairae TaxID=190310 RepID=A0ABQ4PK85_9GAMM|nr:hypothetical protein [Shewanella sairae]MCL1131728.1 hypothetical protein [Shewanella sairae]GIU48174.1 hypothetical protein TUM4438_28970 [Shewanella sairae]